MKSARGEGRDPSTSVHAARQPRARGTNSIFSSPALWKFVSPLFSFLSARSPCLLFYEMRFFSLARQGVVL